MLAVAGYVLAVLLSYLLGSIPFGYLIGRVGGIDIRQWGSKNVGATNVGRILGVRRGVLVFVLDTLKGAAAVGLIGRGFTGWSGVNPSLCLVLSGAAVVLGHTFTCWLRFKGSSHWPSGSSWLPSGGTCHWGVLSPRSRFRASWSPSTTPDSTR